jgi:dihydroorotase
VTEAAGRPIASLDWRSAPDGAPGTTILRSATVLDPRAGIDAVRDVVIREGHVAELAEPGAGQAPDAEEVDAEGLCAAPAFFDPHVHLRTPGREDEEDIETGTRAAAAGGYCGILAMANTQPPVDTPGAIEALRDRARREAAVPVGFLATVTRGMAGEELTEMARLRAAGAIGFSDDGLPVKSARVLRRALQYQRLTGAQIALHEEDPDLSGAGAMHEGAASALLGIEGIPSVSESTMIARDCALAGHEEARVHIQHLSARESVEAVAAAKAAGVNVTCEATPHHLTLTEDEVRSLDARFKMNPPLRSEGDRQALIDGLRTGLIDCVATDHAPHSADEKEVPFEEAAMGVTGLETAFAVLHTELVLPGVLGLDVLLERMSAGAAAFGLEPTTLARDAEANIVLFDPAMRWEAGADGWESRSQNSCFDGLELTGRVLMTIAGGRVAYRQRAFAVGVA